MNFESIVFIENEKIVQKQYIFKTHNPSYEIIDFSNIVLPKYVILFQYCNVNLT